MRSVERERLHLLADSINETARMARASLSFFLLFALYLGLTLLSSADENVFLDSLVLVPQVGVGISVRQSYLFAPLILLYLHGQSLLMLSVLARKMRNFEVALEHEFPSQETENSSAETINTDKIKQECRNWLSAFSFVQVFRPPDLLSRLARLLSWFVISAVPVALLIGIDVSFLRYQSDVITGVHHIVLTADVALVFFFYRTGFYGAHSNILTRAGVYAQTAFAFSIVMILVLYGWSPNGFEKRDNIWRHDPSSESKAVLNPASSGFGNLLDAWPCNRWNTACRYLDVSDLDNTLGRLRRHALNEASLSEIVDLGELRNNRVIHTNLDGRNFRFVKLRSANLVRADLRGASLETADLRDAYLQEANLRYAKLHKADLSDANLQASDLFGVKLHDAVLGRTRLQNADLRQAELPRAWLYGARMEGANMSEAEMDDVTIVYSDMPGANLADAELANAELWSSNMRGVNLRGANLQNANLRGTKLQGADLGIACLQGADLGGADLQGADLAGASLNGANLEDANLRGANLLHTDLRYSTGLPRDWYLTWMPEEPKGDSRFPLEDCPSDARDSAKQAKKDMMYSRYRQIHATTNISSPDYVRNWVDWTVEFACRNVYNGRSSMKRWASDTLEFESYIPGDARKGVWNALIDARANDANCKGLAEIPENEWKKLLERYGYV